MERASRTTVREARYTDRMSVSDILPILAAGVVSAIIGFVWYHPRVFGGIWMRFSGITPEAVERRARWMSATSFAALLASIAAAYAMRHFIAATGVYDTRGALELVAWVWAGFAAPALLGSILWEQRSFALYLVNAFYWFVALMAMAIVLLF